MMVNDCNFCIHNRVCGIKFRLKDEVEMHKGINLTVCCDEYIPAMDKPEEPVEDVAEAPTVEKATKKRAVRRKAKG